MNNRRQFLKKALYITPVILTARIRPAFAGTRYTPPDKTGGGGDKDPNDWWQFWRKL